MYLFQWYALWLLCKETISFYKLIEYPRIKLQKHSFFSLRILVGKKALAGRVQLYAIHLSPYKVFKLLPIRFVINAPVNKKTKVGEQFAYFYARTTIKTLKVHQYPRRNTTNEGHILRKSFCYNSFYFCFPIFNTICFIRRHTVSLQISRYVMGYNARKATYFDAIFFAKYRATLQKYHFAIYKISFFGFVYVAQYSIASALYVMWHRIFGNRDILSPAGST